MPERGPAQVAWLTMFLDLAPAAHAETAAFWASVTGSTLSAARGDDGEFATLLPADGDAYLRVQRLGGGPSRVHLDVHAADLDALAGRAVGLGAEVVRRLDDVVVLRSPGGFPLCAVAQAERTLSAPVDWGTHTSRMDQVCLDVPRHLRETETRFWAGLLGEDPTPSPTYPEFTDLRRAAHCRCGSCCRRWATAVRSRGTPTSAPTTGRRRWPGTSGSAPSGCSGSVAGR